MDLHQQIPTHLNYIENKFSTLSLAFDSYGITISDLLIASVNSNLISISKKIGRSLIEINNYVKVVKEFINDQNKPTSIDTHIKDDMVIPSGIGGLDIQLNGGIPLGYITEIFGASGCGKSQLLFQLAIQAQLNERKRSIYISTESILETRRLNEMIANHPRDILMDNIDYVYCDDLECQDHILMTQLPVKLSQHPRGTFNAIFIDSIGHHLRREDSITNEKYLLDRIEEQEALMQDDDVFKEISTKNHQQLQKFFKSDSLYQTRINKRKYLMLLQRHLIELAQTYNVAVIIANQVSDQPANEDSNIQNYLGNDDPINFNYQLGQFSGWDNETISKFQHSFSNSSSETTVDTLYSELMHSFNKRAKTNQSDTYNKQESLVSQLHHAQNRETKRIIPSLGYTWAKNIGCKLLLLKNYKPILKDKLEISNDVYPEEPTTDPLQNDHKRSFSQLDSSNNPVSSIEDLIDGWQVERYIKVVLSPFLTENLHNQRDYSKIPVSLDQHGFH